MAIDGHFETLGDRDGAGNPRQPRRAVRLEARGTTAAGEGSVTVHNLSASGALLESAARLEIGETIAIDLPEAGEVPAEVVWTNGRLFGCAFLEPVSQAVLSAAQLRSTVGASPDLAPAARLGGRSAAAVLGSRIQALRRERGLTLSELARRLGVSKPTVWAWEQGKARPVDSRIVPLAGVLGVDAETLVLGSGEGGGSELVARARNQIAAAFGVPGDRVRIMIDL
jgi:transcriptional regulator with XRE-family HTH domain